MKKLRAAALYGGIGSMLIAAKQEGFEIAGNVEPRKKHFPEATFKHNFGLPLLREATPELLAEWNKSVDLLLMHPSCGKFSAMQYPHPGQVADDNFPVLLKILPRVKSPVVIMDNLPGAAEYFQKLGTALSSYDLFPETIEAQFYGVAQRRRRLFIVAVHRDLAVVFQPNEHEPSAISLEVMSKIPRDVFNHFPHQRDVKSSRGSHPLLDVVTGKYIRAETIGAMADLLLRNHRHDGKRPNLRYKRPSELTDHSRPGIKIIGPRPTITGTNWLCHPATGLPLSIRERARLQGFPDNFVLLPPEILVRGAWNLEKNSSLMKQVGKAVPIPVTRAFVKQAKAWLLGKEPKVTGQRFTKSDPEVDTAKMKYCKTRGYSNQRAACEACAIHDTCEVRDAVLSKRR